MDRSSTWINHARNPFVVGCAKQIRTLSRKGEASFLVSPPFNCTYARVPYTLTTKGASPKWARFAAARVLLAVANVGEFTSLV